jgi:hypothetical protein
MFGGKPLLHQADRPRRSSLGPADFADFLIGKSNRGQGCEATATFDKAAALLPEFEPI